MNFSDNILNRIDITDISPIELYVSEPYLKHLNELLATGLTVIRNAHPLSLCEQVIEEYRQWCEKNAEYVTQNLDIYGHEKRLVDFHHTSSAAMQIGNNENILKFLDLIFGAEAGVYTSLTFKYGTQQPAHRDAPHFATWPENRFVGVWTALEDVSLNQGPLFYHNGSHKFPIFPAEIVDELSIDPITADPDALIHMLDVYNGKVLDLAKKLGPAEVLEFKAGDTVIWHPQTIHGGSPAKELEQTRWSIVFHCAPINTQVYQYQDFFKFAKFPDGPPQARYSFKDEGIRKVAIAGRTAFM